jgi:uncharacterized membrane protein
MIDFYLLKFLHVLGAAALLGAGVATGFFMLLAHRSGDPRLIAGTAGMVVLADYLFTGLAGIAQPLTGLLLARWIGWELTEAWLLASLALYIGAGLFWLPVVQTQAKMRDLAREAVTAGAQLPASYYRLFRLRLLFGVLPLGALLMILLLMVARPSVDL